MTADLVTQLGAQLRIVSAPPTEPDALDEWCSTVARGLQALAAAYREGADTRRQLSQRWIVLTRILDALPEGLMVCDRAGRTMHANPAFSEFIEQVRDPERIQEEITVLLRSLGLLSRDRCPDGGTPVALVREVRAGEAHYVLRGVHVGGGSEAEDPATLVVLDRVAPQPPSDKELQERFDLTDRQLRVAHLLAEGKSNAAIGRALSISRHTARHHVEGVLLKLGVHSRTEAAMLLLKGEA